jgi:uncharacterized RDD family membrane protein YckC
MSWYYAESNDRRGPVDETTFRGLVASGTITPQTLVWTEGMTEWTPYQQVAASAPVAIAEPPAPTPRGSAGAAQVCRECGGMFPADEMISYEGRYICAGCKPLFFQKVREGASVAGEHEYAGFWIRFVAKFVDGIVGNIIAKLLGVLIGLAVADVQVAMWLAAGISLVVNAGYSIYFTGKYGATPGKMACKLQVIRPEGEPLTYGRATGRYFAELLSSLTLLVGYIMAAFDEEKRALHDRICDTRVVRKR